ncbi:MAG TPA: lysylphosphatidylglycerol synthase transmembrane domain-containing protein [Desulfuromonadaceae bacterium]|jgi:hypothetical protein
MIKDKKTWFGIGISIFFMLLLLRKIDFDQLAAALKTVDYRYLVPAVLFTFISYFLRAVRWKYLLIQEKDIPIRSLYPATIIGYMANNLLPARLGEFIRAYVLAQREGLQAPSVFASLVIDRLFDGGTVMLMLLLTLFTLHLPQGMAEAETVLRTGGIITFVLYSVVIIFLVLLKRQTMKTLSFVRFLLKAFSPRLSESLIPLLGAFIGGIRMSRHGRHVGMVLITSVLIWIFALLPIDMILKGFGINLPISASMFIMVLLVFAVMVPASPGFIGTYHYACFKGLSAFGISDSVAISIALIIHGTAFFPVILAGFYHLWSEKMSLSNLRAAREDKI